MPINKSAGDAGAIATDVNVATGKMAIWLVIPERAAVILVFPAAKPVAKPVEDMDAIFGLELDHVTFAVTSAVESSEKVPEAVNRTLSPTPKLSGVAGTMLMADKDGGATVNFTDALVMPDTLAVKSTLPWTWAVTNPEEEMEAIFGSELVQVAFVVTSAVELSA